MAEGLAREGAFRSSISFDVSFCFSVCVLVGCSFVCFSVLIFGGIKSFTVNKERKKQTNW